MKDLADWEVYLGYLIMAISAVTLLYVVVTL